MKFLFAAISLAACANVFADTSSLKCDLSKYFADGEKTVKCPPINLTSQYSCLVGEGACDDLAVMMSYVQKDEKSEKTWIIDAGPGHYYDPKKKACDLTTIKADVRFPRQPPAKFSITTFFDGGAAYFDCVFTP